MSRDVLAIATAGRNPPPDQQARVSQAPQVSVVAPTYNEKGDIRPPVRAIAAAMGEVPWELIVVVDDSPDGTWREVAEVARVGLPVRCIRRVGRRGLASAVVEGAMSAAAGIVAGIDADMQHDVNVPLPRPLSHPECRAFSSRSLRYSSVFNFGVATRLVWGRRRRAKPLMAPPLPGEAAV